MTLWSKRSRKSNAAETMDFENMNLLNAQLNLISGNLFPMTEDDSGFTSGWRIYSVASWLFLIFYSSALFSGMAMVPKEKTINDGMTIIMFNIEMFCMTAQIYASRSVAVRFIRGMNDALRTQDKILRRIVVKVVQRTLIPLKFYLIVGGVSMLTWMVLPFGEISKKSFFDYVDYKVPFTISEQPFTTMTLVLGTLFTMLANTYVLLKKLSMDSYMVYMVQLMTAQYRYIALKLKKIFQNGISENTKRGYKVEKEYQHEIEQRMKREMRALCLRHNGLIHMSFILKELLSFHVSLTYVFNIFRYCCLGMMVLDMTSRSIFEYVLILGYVSGSIVEFYMVCCCVQELLDASRELTEKAFHEDWFRCGLSIRRTFLLMIMANNLECKLAKVGNFNLALPSLLMIFKQAYAFAILFLKVKNT